MERAGSYCRYVHPGTYATPLWRAVGFDAIVVNYSEAFSARALLLVLTDWQGRVTPPVAAHLNTGEQLRASCMFSLLVSVIKGFNSDRLNLTE